MSDTVGIRSCDEKGCTLGPLGPEEHFPRFYRMKSDPQGPVLMQFRHEACHTKFLVEKTGFEAVTDLSRLPRIPARPVRPEPGKASNLAALGGQGCLVNSDGRTASYQRSRGRFSVSGKEKSRVERMWMREREKPKLSLGQSALSKILRERERKKAR